MFTTVCAWCNEVISATGSRNSGGILSHGLCQSCHDRYFAHNGTVASGRAQPPVPTTADTGSGTDGTPTPLPDVSQASYGGVAPQLQSPERAHETRGILLREIEQEKVITQRLRQAKLELERRAAAAEAALQALDSRNAERPRRRMLVRLKSWVLSMMRHGG
ncbi:MAG: hypothetical protein ACE5FJ_00030 [Gemmatimonadales bacterium]